jgi:hypothetical protein
LPDELLPDALAVATKVEHQFERAEALVALAPRLPDLLAPAAIKAAQGLSDPEARAVALAAFGRYLHGDRTGLHRVWDEAVRAAARRGQVHFAQALRRFVPLIDCLAATDDNDGIAGGAQGDAFGD